MIMFMTLVYNFMYSIDFLTVSLVFFISCEEISDFAIFQLESGGILSWCYDGIDISVLVSVLYRHLTLLIDK